MQEKNAPHVIAKEPQATAAISTLPPHRPSIFLGVPTRFAAHIRKEQTLISLADKVCVSPQRSPTCSLVIPTGPPRSLRHFDRSAAEWRNLAGNWTDLSVRDQIPPLRKAAPHSGRNDKMYPCFSHKKNAVFLRRPGGPWQSRVLRQKADPRVCDCFVAFLRK